MTHDSFADHCREIVQRFLLTAVVVDDELSASPDARDLGEAARSGRRAARGAPPRVDPPSPPSRPLKVKPLTTSFAGAGMVCGVLPPPQDDDGLDTVAKAIAPADIIILDWRLSRATGANALPLLERILREDQPHRLRLIAFYTGEPHQEVRNEIIASLNSLSGPDRAVSTRSDGNGAIDFGPCRIVVYAKPDSPALERSIIVQEEDLANRLIGDFADMVKGLLPSLVLTALSAVRENVYQVLERFAPDIDPAFLTHRACLPQPPESEQHMVEQIASELHGIMEGVVSRASPAGIAAIELWIKSRFGDNPVVFDPGRKMSHTEALAMLTHGIDDKPGPLEKGKRKGKDFLVLSQGFSGGTDIGRELDRRLASAMSFRQVLADTSRQLTMGTVVRRIDDNAMLLCVTPSCDAVRLTERSSFLFLPLSDPKSKTLQVVVPVGEGEHQRMTISLKPSRWCIKDFEPDPDRQCVLAHPDGPDQPFVFKDVGDREYVWVGELKPEVAQSIAQAIAERMSRIPLNQSEWPRRSQRFGARQT